MNYHKYKRRYLLAKNNNKIKGALMGVILGDAFGARYERVGNNVSILINDDYVKYNDYKILGGGVYDLVAGQVTDDSEMMFGLLEAIVENGEYNQEKVAKKYIRWINSEPFDKGSTITKALSSGAEDYLDMINNSKEQNMTTLSNGSLMRIIPLAIYGVKVSDEELRRLVELECELTHPNKLVVDMCFVYCLAVKYNILGKLNKIEIYEFIKSKAKCKMTLTALNSAKTKPEPTYVKKKGWQLTDGKVIGYIGIAIQNAFYEYLYTEDVNEAIINVAKRGGDTDTNCAIVGGLMGSYYGSGGFRRDWYETVVEGSGKAERYKRYEYLDPRRYLGEMGDKLVEIVSGSI